MSDDPGKNTKIGLNIRSMRLRRDLSINDLAAFLELTPSFVERWESGGDVPIERLQQMAEIFGCTLGELCNA